MPRDLVVREVLPATQEAAPVMASRYRSEILKVAQPEPQV